MYIFLTSIKEKHRNFINFIKMHNRRSFLKASGVLGLSGLAGLSGCSPGKMAMQYADERYQAYLYKMKFPKAKVSLDRVIKETVGLRPFRTHGPRVEKEILGSKTIIHNYGHGGSGWSLSWGTSSLATELAASTGYKKFAVLGCGVMGITTATLLQERGYEVSIYTKALHPDITSSKATGTWSPAHALIDDEHITDEFVAFWEKACQTSFTRYQNLLGLNEIAQWVDTYRLSDRPSTQPGSSARRTFHIPGLEPDAQVLTESEHPFGSPYVINQSKMIFNIPSYLQAHMNRFIAFGGDIHIREIQTLEDIDALPEQCVMNCMGLGSKAVFNDDKLMPISGQLAFLIPDPNINYMLMGPQAYWIPRKDGLVLGGTHKRGSWDTTPDPDATARIVANIKNVMDEMSI